MERTGLVTFADVDAFTNEEISAHMKKYGYGKTEDKGDSLRLGFMYVLIGLGLMEEEDALMVNTAVFRASYTENVLPSPPERGEYTRAEWIYIALGRCPHSLLSSLRNRGKNVTYDTLNDLYAGDFAVTKELQHHYFASRYGKLTGEYTFDGETSIAHESQERLASLLIVKTINADFRYRSVRDIIADEIRLTSKASKIYPLVQEIAASEENKDMVVIALPLGLETVKEAINDGKGSPIDKHTKFYEKAKRINNMLEANRIYHYGFTPENTFVDAYDNLWLTEFNAASDVQIPELRATFEDSWSIRSITP